MPSVPALLHIHNTGAGSRPALSLPGSVILGRHFGLSRFLSGDRDAAALAEVARRTEVISNNEPRVAGSKRSV